MEHFTLGQVCHYWIGSDAYPVVVTKVSPSGKSVTVRSVTWKLSPSTAPDATPGCDYTSEDVQEIAVKGDSNGETFRFSKKTKTHKNGGYRHLRPGFRYVQDPHF